MRISESYNFIKIIHSLLMHLVELKFSTAKTEESTIVNMIDFEDVAKLL